MGSTASGCEPLSCQPSAASPAPLLLPALSLPVHDAPSGHRVQFCAGGTGAGARHCLHPRSLSSDPMGIGTSAEGLVVAVAVPPGCTELAASSGRKQAFLAQLLVLGIFKKFLAANFSCATSQLPERIEYDHIT